jgi:hypothetical protein
MQRLDPAAGAEVEHRADRRAGRRGGERERRAADAGDVVALLAAGVEVRQDPPLATVVRTVRAQVQSGGPAVARAMQQAGRSGVVGGQRGEHRGNGRVRLDRPQQQHPHQHSERAAVGGGAERRLGLAPAERGVRLPAEQTPHAVGAVVGPVQRGAQRVGGGGGDLGQHRPILADAPRTAGRRGGQRRPRVGAGCQESHLPAATLHEGGFPATTGPARPRLPWPRPR